MHNETCRDCVWKGPINWEPLKTGWACTLRVFQSSNLQLFYTNGNRIQYFHLQQWIQMLLLCKRSLPEQQVICKWDHFPVDTSWSFACFGSLVYGAFFSFCINFKLRLLGQNTEHQMMELFQKYGGNNKGETLCYWNPKCVYWRINMWAHETHKKTCLELPS